MKLTKRQMTLLLFEFNIYGLHQLHARFVDSSRQLFQAIFGWVLRAETGHFSLLGGSRPERRNNFQKKVAV